MNGERNESAAILIFSPTRALGFRVLASFSCGISATLNFNFQFLNSKPTGLAFCSTKVGIKTYPWHFPTILSRFWVFQKQPETTLFGLFPLVIASFQFLPSCQRISQLYSLSMNLRYFLNCLWYCDICRFFVATYVVLSNPEYPSPNVSSALELNPWTSDSKRKLTISWA